MCAITVDPQSCPTGGNGRKYLDRFSSSFPLPLITGRSPLWISGDRFANLSWAFYKVVLPNTNQRRNIKVPSERTVNYTISTNKSSGASTDTITAATVSELAEETRPLNQVASEPPALGSEIDPSKEQALSPPNLHLVQFPAVLLSKSDFNIDSKQQSPNSLHSPNANHILSSQASLLTKESVTNVGSSSTDSALTKKHNKAASVITSQQTYASGLKRFTAAHSLLNPGKSSLPVGAPMLKSHHTLSSKQLQLQVKYAQSRKREIVTPYQAQHPTQGTTVKKRRPRKAKLRPDFSSLPTTPLPTLNLFPTPDHPLPKMGTYVCKDRLCTEFLTPLDMFYFNSCTDRQQHAKVEAYRDMPLGKCHFMNGTNREAVALVSLPGSGNTWVRGLLEQATGVCTGRSMCLGSGKLGI